MDKLWIICIRLFGADLSAVEACAHARVCRDLAAGTGRPAYRPTGYFLSPELFLFLPGVLLARRRSRRAERVFLYRGSHTEKPERTTP